MKSWMMVSWWVLGCAATLARGQSYEVGFGGSWSVHRGVGVAALQASGTVGFAPGVGGGVWLMQHRQGRISGEIRYWYQRQPLRLTVGTNQVSFAGYAQAVHYDLLFHLGRAPASTRAYVLIGAGGKGYYGTGREVPDQPYQNLALLTRTSEWKGLAVFGGGVRGRLGEHVSLRLEVVDQLSPFPTKVIAPAPGARIGGWMHTLVPVLGFGFQW